MKVKFKKIILSNCFAYEHLEFDFVQGIHNVSGVNGASKTSIYLALAQGLFNKNPKNTQIRDVSNYITKKPYEITIIFYKGDDEYKVVNSRKVGTISVYKNGINISLKTIPQNLELIRDILEDQYETFRDMTYQSVDSTLDLVEEASDTARKNFINKVLKFDVLDEKLAETKDKIKRIKVEVANKSKLVETLESNILQEKTVGEYIDDQELGIVFAARLGELTALSKETSKIKERLIKLQAQRKARESYGLGLARVEEIDSILHKAFSSDYGSLEEAKDAFALQTRLTTEASLKLNTCNKELTKLEAPESVCSRCGHELDSKQAIKQYEYRLEQAESAVSVAGYWDRTYREKLQQIKEELNMWHDRQKLRDEKEALLSVPKNFEDVSYEELDELNSALDVHNKKLRKLEAEQTELGEKVREAREHNIKIKMVQKFNAETRENNLKIEGRVAKIKVECFELNKRLDLLNNWSRILGSQGYRVSSMNRFLKLLNVTMNKYSEIISGGSMKCSFFVDEEGKIMFTVVDADKSMPYSNWSSGEKSRLKLMCLFSVIELLEVMGSASFNLLFLDEVFASLDLEGREGLFEVLAYLKGKGKCIYTIAHSQIASQLVFDSEIKVCKRDGISYVE